MARCLVVQHVDPEPSYALGEALDGAGVEVETCQVYAGDRVPANGTGYAGVVVMGGPMSAASDNGFPTRRAEIGLLAGAVASGVPTLGICLGAQLLAAAAGGSVFAGTAGAEIGWDRVRLSPGASDDGLLAGLAEDIGVLQWHGDTFDLPPGAVHLASSRRYANQAFRVGPAAWGLQFHLEVTTEAVETFLSAFGGDSAIPPGGAAAIREAMPDALAELDPVRSLVCGRFADLVAARARSAAAARR
jgi:GMP synthase-like glutamine amidotransferase